MPGSLEKKKKKEFLLKNLLNYSFKALTCLVAS